MVRESVSGLVEPLEYCGVQRKMERILGLTLELRTAGSELLVYIRFRDCQKVGYPGCIEVACPWSAGDIAHRGVDVVLVVRFWEMWFLECARGASVVRCERREGRDRCGGGEGGESARAGHGGGGRWEDGAFIASEEELEGKERRLVKLLLSLYPNLKNLGENEEPFFLRAREQAMPKTIKSLITQPPPIIILYKFYISYFLILVKRP